MSLSLDGRGWVRVRGFGQNPNYQGKLLTLYFTLPLVPPIKGGRIISHRWLFIISHRIWDFNA